MGQPERRMRRDGLAGLVAVGDVRFGTPVFSPGNPDSDRGNEAVVTLSRASLKERHKLTADEAFAVLAHVPRGGIASFSTSPTN
jgi:hypothetical protein